MNVTKQNGNILNEPQTLADTQKVSAPAESSLDKVREILFGEQVKENQKEFSFLKQQQETLFANLKNELDTRLESIAHDMNVMRKELDKETIENTHRFNQKLDDIDRTLTELDRLTSELSHEKTDRSTLAELLNQISSKLLED